MNVPSIQIDGHSAVVHMDNMSLWFSYAELIAFRIGAEKVVSENVWSKTTGKHLNECDMGKKEQRVKYDVFIAKWMELTKLPMPQGLLG